VEAEAAAEASKPPDAVAEAERKLRIEIAALQTFPLDGDLAASRARVEVLVRPILDFESSLCTDVECSVLVSEYEDVLAAAVAARAAKYREDKEKARAAARAEEEARAKERAQAISDSASRVIDFFGEVIEDRAKEAEEARVKREKAAAKAKAEAEKAAAEKAAAEKAAAAEEAAAKKAAEDAAEAKVPAKRRWWRPRRFILFGRKLE
jgi:colicin import membrane protein